MIQRRENMETYIYMRISTKEERELQSYQRQDKAIKKYLEENNIKVSKRNIYKDDVSGKTFNRPDWTELEERVKKDIKNDDVQIIFKDISRFARNAKEGFEKYMELYNLGIKLTFLDNPTVSTDYISKMVSKNENMNFVTGIALQSMVNLLIAVELDRAEQQRLYISKAITDGIKASDKKSGRPIGKLDKMSYELKEDILLSLKDRNIKQVDLMKKHKISRNTLKKYIALVEQEHQ